MASASLRAAPTIAKKDVVVMVAMDEEFSMAHRLFAKHATTVDSIRPVVIHGVPFRCFEWEVAAEDKRSPASVSGVTVQSGKGMEAAAASAASFVAAYQPNYVVVLGISGGIKDVNVGDVVVPNTVHCFISDAAAVSAPAGGVGTISSHVDLQPGGSRHGTLSAADAAKLKSFDSDAPTFASWYAGGKVRNMAVCKFLEGTPQLRHVSLAPQFLRNFADKSAHLASSSLVVKTEVFAKWLADHVDRSVVAVDMESGAAVNAITTLLSPPHVLVVRGISDKADAGKNTLETAASAAAVAMSLTSAPAAPTTVAERLDVIEKMTLLLGPLMPYVSDVARDNGTVSATRVLAMANATTWLLAYAAAGHLSSASGPASEHACILPVSVPSHAGTGEY